MWVGYTQIEGFTSCDLFKIFHQRISISYKNMVFPTICQKLHDAFLTLIWPLNQNTPVKLFGLGWAKYITPCRGSDFHLLYNK